MPYRKKKILIVDDSDEVREILSEYLTMVGKFEIISVDNGVDALKKIEEFEKKSLSFDFIFLDWNMPLLNGFETLLEMRKFSFLDKCCIILLTAEMNPDDIKKFREAKINFIMHKPFDFEIVRNLLSKLI